jgi:hypothetical protein
MKYEILQINLTATMVKEVNKLGHIEAKKAFPAYSAHLECSCFGSARFTPDMLKHYGVVATVDASDLEEVFEVGNGYGDQSKITVKGSMHSLSVGDIVRNDGNTWMCDSVGWTRLSI